MSTDPDEVAALIAKTFVARRDVKALQSKSGAYMPVTDTGKPDGERLPWTMGDFRAHVAGKQTFGHYVVSKENTAKVFCFDLDLEKELRHVDPHREPTWRILNPVTWEEMVRSGSARDAWHPTRLWQWCVTCRKGWYTDFQEPRCTDPEHEQTIGTGQQPDTLALTVLLQETAFRLARKTRELLEIPVAVLFSGNKGLHVYGITGEQNAADVRAAADIVLDSFDGRYAPVRGKNFYADRDADYEAVSVEVFPKQEALDDRPDALGNLLRLPLGVNRKNGERSFFLESRIMGELHEMNPVLAMTEGTPA